jgi:PhzF family phenazine biosynthesis protein
MEDEMMVKLYQVDAFTGVPFRGNPAAVCLLPGPAEKNWMQSLAAEMNLSETAFLVKQENGYGLRWFTPAVEVDLCGHATLASAHVLYEIGKIEPDQETIFHTASGVLKANKRGEKIELNFPVTPAEEIPEPPGLTAALGVKAVYIGKSRFDYLVRVNSELEVREANPDIDKLNELGVRGIMLTSQGEGDYDFISRFFAPGAGIDEDPVTGSAHCCLGPYWGRELGKVEMSAFQASARGGEVGVRLVGERVHLTGKAITIFQADLMI